MAYIEAAKHQCVSNAAVSMLMLALAQRGAAFITLSSFYLCTFSHPSNFFPLHPFSSCSFLIISFFLFYLSASHFFFHSFFFLFSFLFFSFIFPHPPPLFPPLPSYLLLFSLLSPFCSSFVSSSSVLFPPFLPLSAFPLLSSPIEFNRADQSLADQSLIGCG